MTGDEAVRYVDLNTSLTIDNLAMRDVGTVLALLRDAGFVVEVNLSAALAGSATPTEDT